MSLLGLCLKKKITKIVVMQVILLVAEQIEGLARLQVALEGQEEDVPDTIRVDLLQNEKLKKGKVNEK